MILSLIVFENDDNQGLAMGVVVGGFGGGAFIFNQIQVSFHIRYKFKKLG